MKTPIVSQLKMPPKNEKMNLSTLPPMFRWSSLYT